MSFAIWDRAERLEALARERGASGAPCAEEAARTLRRTAAAMRRSAERMLAGAAR